MSRFKKLLFGSICAVALLGLSAQESQAGLFCGLFNCFKPTTCCYRPVSCYRPVRCYRPVQCCAPACATPACSTGSCGTTTYYGGTTYSAPSCGTGGCGAMLPNRSGATAVRTWRIPQSIARPFVVPAAPRYTAPVRVRTRNIEREPIARRIDSRVMRTSSARRAVRVVNSGWVAVSN